MARIALVTGASKGIGRGIAYGLAEDGWDVAVNYNRDEAGARETAQKVLERGRRAWVVQADVGFSGPVRAMFERVLSEAGGLDLLVNNAGVQTWSPLLELKEEDWDRTLRTNLKGTFLCTQLAARAMLGKGGSIVNIGSGCNKIAFPNLVDYTASKGGLDNFTMVAAVELGPYGIRVNSVAPGAVEIERTRRETADYAGTWGAATPMRRVGEVEDVAAAVVFLAGAKASFITGQTLYVDGGLFAQPPWPSLRDREAYGPKEAREKK
jgi:NAD(P)-dependent dehydrogenase (short-subunit alcohol dehydrogenase family)